MIFELLEEVVEKVVVLLLFVLIDVKRMVVSSKVII